MKKQCLIVLATVAAIIIGLGSLASVQGSDISQGPGITVVIDEMNDLQLKNCNPSNPDIPCSLPPGAPLSLPGYFDIKTARITEIGRGLVDLSIKVSAPIPENPPLGFVSYIWQFAGGCVGPNPQPGDKDSISVVWQDWGNGMEWRAYWYVIENCSPRAIERGEEVLFQFTDDGVKVRVALDDLSTATNNTGTLIWHAAVRRIPFIYSLSGKTYTNTVAADYAPDVVEFNPSPPPIVINPELPATWLPR